MEISGAGEIVTDSGFYSYDSKYNDEQDAAITVPAPITTEQVSTFERLHGKSILCFCLIRLSRVDFFFAKIANIF